MNNTTVVLAAVVFVLVGILIFAAVAPFLSSGVDATVLIKKCPKGDRNPDRPGCGPGGPPLKGA